MLSLMILQAHARLTRENLSHQCVAPRYSLALKPESTSSNSSCLAGQGPLSSSLPREAFHISILGVSSSRGMQQFSVALSPMSSY